MKSPTSKNNSTVIQADMPLGPLIGTPEAVSARAVRRAGPRQSRGLSQM
jgi:hypothetical protein